MNKIYIVGSINMDLVIKSPVMPKNGETLSGSGFLTNPGGKGANQAVAVSKLGGNAYMVGCVGKGFGRELKDTLKGYNVNTDNVEEKEDVSSGIAVIIVVDGDNRIILDAGSNACVGKNLVDKAFENAASGDYLICQLEIPQETVKYALQQAKKKGMITVFNPAPAVDLIDGILEYCDYFIPNQSEAEKYTGIYPKDEETSKLCAKRFNSLGVNNLVVTMGDKGCCAVIDGKYIKVDAERVKPVDTTVAGDTFVGAFTVGLSEGLCPVNALKFSSKAAAITITREGAQKSIPFRQEIK